MNKQNQTHVINYLKKGVRYDGRKLDQYREIEVEAGNLPSAEGSARVKMGDTEVLCGIKFEVGKPYPDSPDAGTMMVNSELIPMSNPDFESGPPSIDSIELSRVVDRGIRESGAIDFKKLCIKEGEQVWTVIVDVVPINDAGNLFDAASLAVMTAVKNAKFPELVGEKINYKKKTNQGLPINAEPVSVTVLKIGDHLLVDPIKDEQLVIDARLTVAFTKDNTICAMQKGGDSPLSIKEIEQIIDLATKKAKELRKYLG
jgi:exosome complex component RRP42